MSRGILTAAMIAVALVGCRASTDQAQPEGTSEAGLRLVQVAVSSKGKRHLFTAEVAETPEQQARGLMFRESIAPDAAMLFPFSPPRGASFWMKDTLIPLDMIFIRPDGSIAFIAAETLPQSEVPVGVEEPLAAVVEIAGGRAAELGIEEGDRVSWPGGPTP